MRRCLALLLLAAVLGGCAPRGFSVPATSPIPAVTGSVDVQRIRGDRARVILNVQGLAPIRRAYPDRTGYVVWTEGPLGEVSNKGTVFMTDDLRAVFTTTTEHYDFEIFITPEVRVDAALPSGERVFTASVQRD